MMQSVQTQILEYHLAKMSVYLPVGFLSGSSQLALEPVSVPGGL